MRIGVVVNTFPKLSETFVLGQITGLLELGHDVRIVARGPSEDPVEHPEVAQRLLHQRSRIQPRRTERAARLVWTRGTQIGKALAAHPIRTLRTTRDLDRSFWDTLFVSDALEHHDVDIVLCHFGPNGELVARLKRAGFRYPLVTMFHGYDVRWAGERGAHVYRRLFAYGDRFLGVSRFTTQRLSELGADAAKTQHHPVGIDLDTFRPPSARRTWSPGEQLVVLTVARLHDVKGLAHGLRALKRILDSNPGLRLEYRLAGEGPEEAPLRKLASELGLQRCVRFLGGIVVDQVVAEYQWAHIFMLPSLAEALSVVLMEAQASGLPVVTTHVGGTNEVVADGESGLLVPPGDADALADGLQRLIDAPDTWCAMGERGRHLIASSYDARILNHRLEDILVDVLDRTTRAR